MKENKCVNCEDDVKLFRFRHELPETKELVEFYVCSTCLRSLLKNDALRSFKMQAAKRELKRLERYGLGQCEKAIMLRRHLLKYIDNRIEYSPVLGCDEVRDHK